MIIIFLMQPPRVLMVNVLFGILFSVMQCCVIPAKLISCAMISFPIVSHHITSYRIVLYCILSSCIVPYPLVSYPIALCRILSYRIAPYCVVSHHIVSYPILPYSFLSYGIVFYPFLSYPILSYPCYSILFYALPCSLTLCYSALFYPGLSYPMLYHSLLCVPLAILCNVIRGYEMIFEHVLASLQNLSFLVAAKCIYLTPRRRQCFSNMIVGRQESVNLTFDISLSGCDEEYAVSAVVTMDGAPHKLYLDFKSQSQMLDFQFDGINRTQLMTQVLEPITSGYIPKFGGYINVMYEHFHLSYDDIGALEPEHYDVKTAFLIVSG